MWFDIVCLIIIVIGFFFGFKKGFIAQAGSVLGVVAGIICCNLFSDKLAAKFSNPEDGPETLMLHNVMAYILIFVGCYIIGRIVGSTLSRLFKSMHLGLFDKLCGAVFTMLEYTLAFSILLNAWIGAFPNTKLRSNYNGVKQFVLDFAPDILGSQTVNDIFNSFNDTTEDVKDTIETARTLKSILQTDSAQNNVTK